MAEGGASAEASSSAPSRSTGVKLFLGGLSWNTTEEDLRSHFGPYGKMHEVVVMRDRVTDKPRGFGFVTFADEAVADKVCAERHELQGRQIDAKRSVPPTQQPRSKKVFVGGLAPATREEEFQEYFAKFGPVSDAQIMVDHQTGRSRGFGFVTFEQDSSVEQVFRMGAMHELAGKRVEVKSATPRGSGPVASNRNIPMGRIWGTQRSMTGRGMGFYPGPLAQPGLGMGPYGPVGYNPAMMPGYPLNAFGPNPYGPYANPLMAAQMSQMGQLSNFGYGNYGPYGAAAAFTPQALAASQQQGLAGPQQALAEGFDQQQQAIAESFPQNSPNASRFHNYSGRGQQRQ